MLMIIYGESEKHVLTMDAFPYSPLHYQIIDIMQMRCIAKVSEDILIKYLVC